MSDMLEELTCRQLQEICARETLAQTYTRKEQLIERIQDHFSTTFTATPDEEFFSFLRKQWKEAKGTTADKSKEEHFGECMKTWNQEDFGGSLINMSDAQIKAHAHIGEICKTHNPANSLMEYYRRGKTAWLDEKDSSSDEGCAVSGCISGSDSNYSDDKSDKSDDADEEDENEDEDDDQNEDDDEEAEQAVVVDFNVCPATTWEDARQIPKPQWIRNRVWYAYFEKLLGTMPKSAWTMKRFMQHLCVHKKMFAYNKNLSGKACAQLLDNGRIQPKSGAASAKKKVCLSLSLSHTHTLSLFLSVSLSLSLSLSLFLSASFSHPHPTSTSASPSVRITRASSPA